MKILEPFCLEQHVTCLTFQNYLSGPHTVYEYFKNLEQTNQNV